MVASVEECLHAVLWEGAVGLLPAGAALRHARPGIAFVPVGGHPPSCVVTARLAGVTDPLVDALADALDAARQAQAREGRRDAPARPR
ncbi:hypothetical protein ACFQFR_35475 [Streptomyces goshikiensis]